MSGGIPYIDFHYGNDKIEDFNARIINDGDQHLGIQVANLAVSANLQVGGTLHAAVDAAHAVGDPGEPSYSNSFTGWQDGRYDVGAHFYKVGSSDEVTLYGLVKIPNPFQGVSIFLLPAGYRPGRTKIFVVVMSDAFAMLEVLADGSVQTRGMVAPGGWLCLSGVSFRAEQ